MWAVLKVDGIVVDRLLNPTIQDMAAVTSGLDLDFEYQPCVGNWDDYLEKFFWGV